MNREDGPPDEPESKAATPQPLTPSVPPAAPLATSPAHVPVLVTSGLIERAAVPQGLTYPEYRPFLREDFIYSCAYCTIMEAEATASRMTIDHYEPQTARPELVNDYANLLYACDECNRLKGARCPPADARAAGHRFFRPDADLREDHFERTGLRVKGKTTTGEFTVEMVDLNRQSLRRLREIRERVHGCMPLIEAGIRALQRLPLDQLPPTIRAPAISAVGRATDAAERVVGDVDAVLKSFARSPLADEDPEAEDRRRQRVAFMKEKQALWPGLWAAPRKARRSRPSRRRK